MRDSTSMCGLGVLCCALMATSASADYDVTALGTLGGGEARALGVNSSGQVVGRSRIVVNQYALWHAYRYDGGMLDLESLIGEDGESWGYGINEAGQVVGFSETTGWTRGFRWTDLNENNAVDDGEMIDLGTLGGFSSAARAINNSGQVAGTAQMSGGLLKYDHAFLWTDANVDNVADAGEMIDLGTLTGNNADPSHAWAMNDLGNVVGQADAGIQFHAFYFSDLDSSGSSESGEMIDLGTLGGTASHAYGINNSNVVVGVATTADSDSRAFRWTDANTNNASDAGEMVDLGTLGGDDSAAYDINNDGDIVGYAMTAASEVHAFLYQNGVMVDLNDLIDPASGWVLEEAWGISDAGHIVGLGHYNGLPGQAFMLTLESEGLPGDLNGDGFVGLADLDIVLGAWNQTVPPADEAADPSGDGFVGLDDLDIVLNNWNAGTPPMVVPEPVALLVWCFAVPLLHRKPINI